MSKPAFPMIDHTSFLDGENLHTGDSGMTLLEYFTGQALSNQNMVFLGKYKQDAINCCDLAEEAIKECERRQK